MAKPTLAVFGEVLFDCFPDGTQVPGGAPFNVAWHLQALGQQPRLLTRIGQDQAGQDMLHAMQAWGMETQGIQHDTRHATGRVAVSFVEDEPQYCIVAEQAYDFISVQAIDIQADWLYHGSLALRHSASRQTWRAYRQTHAGSVFVDINLRTPWWNPDLLDDILAGADWLKLNQHELEQLAMPLRNHHSRVDSLIERYQLQGVILTQGEAGAALYSAQGEVCTVHPDSAVTGGDSVGAGDAFAAVCLLGLMQSWPYPVMLERAQRLASAIVAQRGAISTNLDFYQSFRLDWME